MSTTATTTRPITDAGTEAGPGAGVWSIDAAHSTVEGVVRHLVSKVRVRFTAFDGTLDLGDDLTDSRIEVTIDAASIDSNQPQRDEHLRTSDFLAVEEFPTLTFVSTGIEARGGDRYAVTGDLTIRGVTRSVVLDASYLGLARDPWGSTKAAFSATTSIDRADFGVNWNQALEAGGVMVGRTVTIELSVQAERVDA